MLVARLGSVKAAAAEILGLAEQARRSVQDSPGQAPSRGRPRPHVTLWSSVAAGLAPGDSAG